MDEKIKMNTASAELTAAFVSSGDQDKNVVTNIASEESSSFKESATSKATKPEKSNNKDKKKHLIMIICGVVGIIGGITCIICAVLQPSQNLNELHFPMIPSTTTSDEVYSVLTGEPLVDSSKKDAPIYCIQTPNGTDGARPQAGLTNAGVIFEAVAEAGITRFAAIYQNPKTAIIGPIRSLRIYYLQWDTPFDCIIVHAGGSGDALAAVSAGGYKDLSEDYSYMYRGTYGSRLWNNLFTTSSLLEQFSTDKGYSSSANAKGFSRMTPEESKKSRIDSLAVKKLEITKPADSDTSALGSTVDSIAIRFGDWASFNTNYTYDVTTNRYLRSYESGATHDVHDCDTVDLGEKNPEDVCTLTQMSPSVIVAMIVQEKKAADNYHEDITAIGSGEAYIFQNGVVVKGKWSKNSAEDQIKFYDDNGDEIKLAPGQTIVSAVPSYGSVKY